MEAGRGGDNRRARTRARGSARSPRGRSPDGGRGLTEREERWLLEEIERRRSQATETASNASDEGTYQPRPDVADELGARPTVAVKRPPSETESERRAPRPTAGVEKKRPEPKPARESCWKFG